MGICSVLFLITALTIVPNSLHEIVEQVESCGLLGRYQFVLSGDPYGEACPVARFKRKKRMK
ncbi:uncharacterized, partial [Tachysurus ichikawai]